MNGARRILFVALEAIFVSVSLPVLAQMQPGAPPSMARMTPEEMRAEMDMMIGIQRQIRNIEQNIKLLEAQNKLNELQRKMEMNNIQMEQVRAGRRREESSLQVSEEQRRIASESMRATVVPRVFAVIGSGRDRKAFVLVPFFGEQSVRVGDIIVGDRYKVEMIDETGVLVRDMLRGNEAMMRLPFGASVPAAPPFQVDLPSNVSAMAASSPPVSSEVLTQTGR